MTYQDVVLATQPANLIAYWPLNETSGTAIVNAAPSGSGYNGVYTGVDLANTSGPGASMGASPYWDGANDYGNILTAPLQAAFNGRAFTIHQWIKAVDWSGSAFRRAVSYYVDDNNTVTMAQMATPGQFIWDYKAAGFESYVITSSLNGESGWISIALTIDYVADQMKAYAKGVQVGITQTGLGAWAGTLTVATIGSLAAVPFHPWLGWLSGVALWSKALTAAEILTLSNANVLASDPFHRVLAYVNASRTAEYIDPSRTLAVQEP